MTLAVTLAVRQEREILMSRRQEYQSEQAGRQAVGGPGDKDNTTHRSPSPPPPHLPQTNRNTKSQSFQPSLHDIVVGVIENRVFRGDVCPHVVGKR